MAQLSNKAKQLLKVGGIEWKKNDHHRIYFDCLRADITATLMEVEEKTSLYLFDITYYFDVELDEVVFKRGDSGQLCVPENERELIYAAFVKAFRAEWDDYQKEQKALHDEKRKRSA